MDFGRDFSSFVFLRLSLSSCFMLRLYEVRRVENGTVFTQLRNQARGKKRQKRRSKMYRLAITLQDSARSLRSARANEFFEYACSCARLENVGLREQKDNALLRNSFRLIKTSLRLRIYPARWFWLFAISTSSQGSSQCSKELIFCR